MGSLLASRVCSFLSFSPPVQMAFSSLPPYAVHGDVVAALLQVRVEFYLHHLTRPSGTLQF